MAGPAEVVADHSWPGTSTTVLRLRAPDGQQMILKSNTSGDSFQRELTALTRWAPALGASAPQLLDADEDAQLLLMTAVTGQPLQSLPLTAGQERRAYERAGALLARFHATAPPTVLPAFGAERAAYIRAQLTDGTHPLTRADLAVLDEALHQLQALPPRRAQPSHLDFTSRNILWSEAETGVIDFETSRYEAVGCDFLRITQRTLHHRPDLRAAFYRGYGREPRHDEGELIETERRTLQLSFRSCNAAEAVTRAEPAFSGEGAEEVGLGGADGVRASLGVGAKGAAGGHAVIVWVACHRPPRPPGFAYGGASVRRAGVVVQEQRAGPDLRWSGLWSVCSRAVVHQARRYGCAPASWRGHSTPHGRGGLLHVLEPTVAPRINPARAGTSAICGLPN
ncbi:aminoglycoside phosphotransferase family protein [Streptomyces sp. NPDC093108]|uniref:aminoglycoside phosphotransferase family protein n=1 Tax=Streptomyces sp. NPDC093108 TaxID=3366030 RepID=UPI0037FD9399